MWSNWIYRRSNPRSPVRSGPQDRVPLTKREERLSEQRQENGRGARAEKPQATGSAPAKVGDASFEVKDGAVLIAAITSCTNTSNPAVLVAAGLLGAQCS